MEILTSFFRDLHAHATVSFYTYLSLSVFSYTITIYCFLYHTYIMYSTRRYMRSGHYEKFT